MADELERQAVDTPADVAQREAAKQAVALVFGIVGALAMIPIYKRIARGQVEALKSVMHDPAMREIEQRQAAAAAARAKVRHWHKVAGVLWPVSSSAAMWALRRAESASKATRKPGGQ